MIIMPHGLLAEIAADAIVWIVIGVVWAAAQIFTRLARRATNAETPEKPATSARQRHTTRPAATHEPVSPNDELRRFLREISGEGDADAAAPVASRSAARSAKPPPRPRTAMTPAAASSGTAKQATATRPTEQRPARRRIAKPPERTPRDKVSPTRDTMPVPGLGNWRTAVIHREILGPPRALRAYDSAEF